MKDSEASPNDGLIVQAVGKADPRIEIRCLSRLNAGTQAVHAHDSRTARQSSQRSYLRIQRRRGIQIQEHVLVLLFAVWQLQVLTQAISHSKFGSRG
jgi:hypothetical protein